MLSIIIPVRNSQDFIGDCLESILKQEAINASYEVLISDNCSTDDTVGAVNAILQKHPDFAAKVKVFCQEKNLGAFGNVNFLLERCAYTHAHILCADDYYCARNSVARIMETIRAHPDAWLFAFDNNTRHANLEGWELIYECVGDNVLDGMYFSKFLFAFECFLGGLSNICINRSKFDGRSYFNPDFFFYADVDFYARAAINGGSLYLLREEITFRRHHAQSISNREKLNYSRFAESIATRISLSEHLRRHGVVGEYTRFYASTQITQFYYTGLTRLLLGEGVQPLRKAMEAHRGSPVFYHPVICLFLAALLGPKFYRNKFQSINRRRFVKYLINAGNKL